MSDTGHKKLTLALKQYLLTITHTIYLQNYLVLVSNTRPYLLCDYQIIT